MQPGYKSDNLLTGLHAVRQWGHASIPYTQALEQWGRSMRRYETEVEYRSRVRWFFRWCMETLGAIPAPDDVTPELAAASVEAYSRPLKRNQQLSVMRGLFAQMGYRRERNPFGPLQSEPPEATHPDAAKECLGCLIQHDRNVAIAAPSGLPFWRGPEGMWRAGRMAPVPTGSLLKTGNPAGDAYWRTVYWVWSTAGMEADVERMAASLLAVSALIKSECSEHHPVQCGMWLRSHASTIGAHRVDTTGVHRMLSGWRAAEKEKAEEGMRHPAKKRKARKADVSRTTPTMTQGSTTGKSA